MHETVELNLILADLMTLDDLEDGREMSVNIGLRHIRLHPSNGTLYRTVLDALHAEKARLTAMLVPAAERVVAKAKQHDLPE